MNLDSFGVENAGKVLDMVRHNKNNMGSKIINKPNWKLVRERDNLTKYSVDIKWIEWDENGCYKDDYQEPTIGRSLLMGPFNPFFTWQTTDITEIIDQKENYIKFNTKNSVYELFKIT